MLGLSELRQIKGDQEALEEGELTDAVRAARSLVLRFLARPVGTLSTNVEAQVQALALSQLGALGKALLGFAALDDLTELQDLSGNV